MENSMEVLQETVNRTAMRPSNPVSGCTSKGTEVIISGKYLRSHTHCSIFHNGQVWEQPKCPSVGKWVKKMWCVCVCIEYCPVFKKKEIPPFATIWMKLEGSMLSEISQIEKDKYCMLSLICGN